MRVLSIAQMVQLEETTFTESARSTTGPKITAENLMEAVGFALADTILEEYPNAHHFLILIGKGNNGGDGLVLARALANRVASSLITVYLTTNDVGSLPSGYLNRLRNYYPTVQVLRPDEPLEFPDSEGVVIDALLGVQAKGPLREPLAELVAHVNEARKYRFFRTVAVDLPSGLAAYSSPGSNPPHPNAAIIADLTITVGFPKSVLCRESLSDWVGRLIVLPWSTVSSEPDLHLPYDPDHELSCLSTPCFLASLLPRRSALSYKGTYGHLFILAGSAAYTGAPILCAQGVLGIGTGLLTILTEPAALPVVASKAPPEAMVDGWIPLRTDQIKPAKVIVFGPGFGSQCARALQHLLQLEIPLVIDAAGLNCLGTDPELLSCLATYPGPLVLTPHTGEMARLIGRKFTVDEREAVAREFVQKHRVTLVLKGTRTLITGPDQPIFYNSSGNPGLSTGGSGDTLSGMIGGLLAQGVPALDAARLAVWLHGRAADLVLRERGCEEGMTPTQVAGKISAALLDMRREASRVGLIEQISSEPQVN